MNPAHARLLRREVALARKLIKSNDLDRATAHLERAHVLGQAQVRWHVLTHLLMLEVAIRRRRGDAAVGQVLRIVLGAIGSAIGRVPTGNPGGSDVSMFAHRPIAPELLGVMQSTSLTRDAAAAYLARRLLQRAGVTAEARREGRSRRTQQHRRRVSLRSWAMTAHEGRLPWSRTSANPSV